MAKRKTTHDEDEEQERPSARPSVFAPDPNDPMKAVQVGPAEVDMTGFEGEYYKKDEPSGSPSYGMKVLKGKAASEAAYGYTHTLKNQEHTWSGTKEQFEAQFSESPPEEEEAEGEPPAV